MSKHSLATLLVLVTMVAVLSCEGGFADDPLSPPPRLMELADGRNGGPSTQFYFLPPIAANPDLSGVTPDGTLAPEVVICTWASGACVGDVEWRLALDAPSGEDGLVVEGDQYKGVWHLPTKQTNDLYRIRIELDGVVLGWVDAVAKSPSAVKVGKSKPGGAYSDPEVITIAGGALPIKFVVGEGVETGPIVALPGMVVSPPADGRVGTGLMDAWSAGFDGRAHESMVVRLASSDTLAALLSADPATPGAASIEVAVAAEDDAFDFWVHGAGAPGTAFTVTVMAPGFATGTAAGQTAATAIALADLEPTLESFSPPDPFQVQVGIETAEGFRPQAVRPDGSPVTARVTTSEPEVARLASATMSMSMAGLTAPANEATVTIAPGASASVPEPVAGGVALEPVSVGRTRVSARLAALESVEAYQEVAVHGPDVVAQAAGVVGSGLQVPWDCALDALRPGGVAVEVRSADPAVALVTADPAVAGAETATIQVAEGETGCGFWVQGVTGATGVANLVISARGFEPSAAEATVMVPSLRLAGVPDSTSSLDDNAPFTVGTGVVVDGAWTAQDRSAAAGPLRVTVTSSDPTVAALVGAAGTGADATATVSPGSASTPAAPAASGGLELDPVVGGTVTIQAAATGFLTGDAARAEVKVSGAAITVGTGLDGIGRLGAGLMESRACYLGTTEHDGATVTITSSDPSLFLVSLSPDQAGAASAAVDVAAGATGCGPFWVHAVEGRAGTGTVSVAAPGFTPSATAVTVQEPAMGLYGLSSGRVAFSSDDVFLATVGVVQTNGEVITQPVRAGAAPLQVTLRSSDPAVGTLVTAAGAAAEVQLSIAAGETASPGAVADGGVAFRSVGAGTTSISAAATTGASQPGSQVVTVSAVTIDVQTGSAEGRVGQGLQVTKPCYLGVSGHGGVTLRIESSNPSAVLVSPDASTPGAAVTQLYVRNYSNRCDFYVQGVEGATGTATITVTATGFSTGSGTAHVVQPAHQVQLLSTTQTAGGAADGFVVRVGVPSAAGTSIFVQPVRAGGAPLDVSVTSSAPTVGMLGTWDAGSAGTVSVQLPVGSFGTPSGLAAGGVEFRPLSAGTTTVSATIPGSQAIPGSSVTVTVR